MTGPGDLPALDVCVVCVCVFMEFRFALDKRKGEKYICAEEQKKMKGFAITKVCLTG